MENQTENEMNVQPQSEQQSAADQALADQSISTFEAKNMKETKKLAQHFAGMLNGGEVVLLLGDLGSGKTAFTREVIRALGFKGIINSPTFTIMQEYHVRKFQLLHYDLYRLENPEESYNFGILENIQNRDINTILFVEWPERISKFLKGDFVVVKIEKTGEESRKFTIEYSNI